MSAASDEELRQRQAALRHFLDGYRDLVLEMDRDRAFSRAVSQVREDLGVAISLGGFLDAPGSLVLRLWSGTRTSELHNLRVRTSLGLGGRVVASGRPHVVSSYVGSQTITHDYDRPVSAEQVQTMAAAPVMLGESTLGALYVGLHDQLASTDVLLDELQGAAAVASLAVDVATKSNAVRERAVAGVRNEVAVDLHDSLGALLFRLGVEARGLADQPGCSELVSTRLRSLESRIGEAMSGLRDCVEGLRRHSSPPSTEDLSRTLAADCLAYEGRRSTPTRLVVPTALPPVDEACRVAVVRCVRESLLNVEKHAPEADRVVVSLSAQHEGILVAVSDDGPGKCVANSSGFGLASLVEEFGRLGGWFEFVNTPDEGSTARGWLPSSGG